MNRTRLLLIGAIAVSAAPNGDLQIGSFLDKPRLLVPMGDGVYRDIDRPERGPHVVRFPCAVSDTARLLK